VTSKSEKRCGFPGQGKGMRDMFQYMGVLDAGVETRFRFVSKPYDTVGWDDIGNVKKIFFIVDLLLP
jgi:hypothetical protein